MKYKTILFTSVIITILHGVVQIITAAAFATDGMTLSSLDTQTQVLDKENTILKEQIYTLSSLTAVVQRATDLGLSENNKSRLVLTNPLPVAFNQ